MKITDLKKGDKFTVEKRCDSVYEFIRVESCKDRWPESHEYKDDLIVWYNVNSPDDNYPMILNKDTEINKL